MQTSGNTPDIRGTGPGDKYADGDQSGVLPLDSLLPNTTSESSSKLADEQRADETLQVPFILPVTIKAVIFLLLARYVPNVAKRSI